LTAKNPNYGSQDVTNSGTDQTKPDQVKQSTSEVTDQTKQAASQVAGQAKQAARSQLAVRKDQTAQGLSAVSSAVQEMGNKLRQNDQTSSYAQYADRAANQVQKFAGYLQSRDVGQIVNEAEDWVRRDPALAIGGAFVLGLLAARFLKSSGVRPASSYRRGARYTPTYRYNNQYYRRNDMPGYGASQQRPTGQYWEDQYRSSGADIKESQY
jgi:hypothetical protein